MTEITSSNICYICGDREANSKDHVFPAGLFNRPLPDNLPPRLPACEECNNGLSKDEELFRVFIAMGMAYESNAGNRIWTERIRPDLKGKRKGLKPLVRSMVKQARVVSESGNILGHIPIFEVNPEPIERVMRKIAKGLYYLDSKQVLPSDVQIRFGYDAGKPERLISPPLDKAIREAKRVEYGNGVVIYWRNIMRDEPANSITWLRFYGDKVFMIVTFRE